MPMLSENVRNKLSEKSLIRRLDEGKSRSVVGDIDRIVQSKIEKVLEAKQEQVRAELVGSDV